MRGGDVVVGFFEKRNRPIMKFSNILVIGGAGFVGSSIVAKLVARGARVTVPTRHRERAKHLIVLPTVEVVEADVNDTTQLAKLMQGKDAVINLPGVLHSRRAKPYGPQFAQAHVDLPRKVGEACAQAGITRLLHMSALGASDTAPSMYLRSKYAGEAAVRDVQDKVAITIFRPSAIYGQGDRFLNLFAALQKWFPVMAVGKARAEFQPIWVEDVALAFIKSLDNDQTINRTYDLAGPAVYNLKQLVQFAGAVAGYRRPVLSLPDFLAYPQAFVMEFAPVKLLSRDNLDSMKASSTMPGYLATELQLEPADMEAVVPSYLAPVGPGRMRLDALRHRAGRGA
jgi:uncharacterized protein YbjT (DUF2867 family)